MKVTVERIVDWNVALDSALFTVSKNSGGKEPSDEWKAKACLAEHSMLADIRYLVQMEDIPSWVSQHLARHDAFAGHTIRETKEVHYVATQRTDRTGIDRSKLPQDVPVKHRINLSAKDLITISRLRLCHCASPETRKVWREVVKQVGFIDPIVAKCCVPNCIYRGFCPEFKSCGFANSELFEVELEAYRELKEKRA